MTALFALHNPERSRLQVRFLLALRIDRAAGAAAKSRVHRQDLLHILVLQLRSSPATVRAGACGRRPNDAGMPHADVS